MTNPFLKIALVSAAAIGSVIILTSCSTPASDESMLLGQKEKAQIASRGKPPQVFGLTAYNSPSGVIFGGGFRTHEGVARKVDFASDSKTTTPIIESDEGFLFLLDSTSTESWLTSKVYKDLRGVTLKDNGLFEKQAQHINDTVGGLAVVVPQLTFDKMRIERCVFFMRNKHGSLDLLTRWENSSKIDGILGADFIRAFKFIRISLKGRYIVLSSSTDYPASNNRIATVPIIRSNDGLTIEAMINGTKKIVLVDIAGDFEMATDAASPEMLRHVSIGDAVYRNVEAIPGREIGLGLEPTPRIGRQLLEKYDLVFNNYGNELILERPASR